jgi:trimeric autotransporter adhesin
MKLCASACVLMLGVCALSVQGAQHAGSTPERTSVVTPAGESTENVPRLVQFNATLKDSAARPVSGVASVTFAIYAEQDGGSPLWSETQNVLADASGHFNVLLGAASPAGVPAELFGTGQSRWLGVTVARLPEMARVLLASVPYALKAGDAQTLGGLPASAFVTTESLGAKSSTRIQSLSSTTILAAASPSASAGAAAPAANVQNAITGTGTANFIPLWSSPTALSNSILFQTGGSIGIGTTTPAEALDVNGNSIFRGSFQLPPGHPATASSGFESHSFQFQASSFNSATGTSSTESFGFRAEPLNNNTPSPSARLDLFFGHGGSAPFTPTGFSFASNGIVTFAPGQNFKGASEALTGSIDLPLNVSGTGGAIITLGGGAGYVGSYGNTNNNFLGLGTGQAATSASSFDNAFGFGSMTVLTSGSSNNALGGFTLGVLSTGGDNTAIGDHAGFTITTGSDNTLIGASADVASPGLSNATAIGADAIVGANNSLVLGGTGSNAVNVGIGTTTPQSTLEVTSPVSDSGLGFPPNPRVTLTNTAGGTQSKVSIDFNTSAPVYGSSYNPAARILAFDEGGFTDQIAFQANVQGEPNQGMQDTMLISANGDVEIIGTLTVDGGINKSGGAFKIDNPIDPSGEYLSHSFVESPDMMNIYNGSVILDANGEAAVTMPRWFEALNRDFEYQLTAVGGPGPGLYVAEEVHENQFKIAGGKAGLKVSWQVTGVRHDAWANAHRIPTEEPKSARALGHYMHPELFGATAEKGIAGTNTTGGNANAR